ncbi:MAG: RdgB/HAM1 family non-canonical purine NTP pyrophosphatase [Clostridia bacterium]|nr:RdgB/HAM1 family non-canonical purine NTP pyrophosphatase [Clostridia bacterium]
MRFVAASKNKKKLIELNRIMQPLGIEVVSEASGEFTLPEVEETGATFLENARLKAVSAMQTTGMPAIADDSGICVEYLNGEPGIYSARYSGENGDDESNNDKLLKNLENVPMEKRDAYFMAAICLVFPNGDEITAEGRVYGKIGFERAGSGGFGYDPLFYVGDRSFGEFSAEEKDAISHRGKALRELKEKLVNYIKENIDADK